MTLSAIVWWGLAWTLLGSVLIIVTAGVAGWIRNAAARHLAWVVAFSTMWLFPVYVAMCVLTREVNAFSCAPLSPLLATPPAAFVSVVLMIWAVGAMVTIARAASARRLIKRWHARSKDYQEAVNHQCAAELAALFSGGIEVRTAVDPEPMVPVTWGTRKPVVLLPANVRAWDVSRLKAVLLHELAHIRRYDNLTQLFGLLTCAFHWFNPLFWHGARRMEAESEIAADDFAILSGLTPSSYAQELLSLASQLSSRARDPVFTQTAMIKPFTLEHRLLAIIDPNVTRGPLRLRSFLPVVVLFFGSVLAIALLTSRIEASLHPEGPAAPDCLPKPIRPT